MFQTLLYIVALVAGYGVAGWLMTCFHASIGVWLITVGIILYIAKAKTGAIAPASAWIVVLITILTVTKAWPSTFSQQFPPMMLWAGALLLLWAFGIGLIVLLAFSKSILRWPQRSVQVLTIIPTLGAFMGLAIGANSSLVTALFR